LLPRVEELLTGVFDMPELWETELDALQAAFDLVADGAVTASRVTDDGPGPPPPGTVSARSPAPARVGSARAPVPPVRRAPKPLTPAPHAPPHREAPRGKLARLRPLGCCRGRGGVLARGRQGR